MEKKLDCFSREVLGILASFFSFSCGKNCYGGNGLQVPQYGSDAVMQLLLQPWLCHLLNCYLTDVKEDMYTMSQIYSRLKIPQCMMTSQS